MTLNEREIHALCARFHLRAEVLGLKAKASINVLDAARFSSMAAALQWAAQELSLSASRSKGATDLDLRAGAPGSPNVDSAPVRAPDRRERPP